MNLSLVTGILVFAAAAVAIAIEVQVLVRHGRAMNRLARRKASRTTLTATLAPLAPEFAKMLPRRGEFVPVTGEMPTASRGRSAQS